MCFYMPNIDANILKFKIPKLSIYCFSSLYKETDQIYSKCI